MQTDGYVTIGTQLDTKDFEAQINEVEGKLEEIDEMLKAPKDYKLTSSDIDKLIVDAEKLNNKLIQLRQKQKQLDNPPNKFIKGLQSAGNETEKLIKRVGRWALAVFGVRSAYLFIRQAMSTLSSYDDQLATNVEYIRYLLANSLKPIIEYLVNLAYQLLQYLNMLAQAWFNINLFASASTEEFMKQKKAMQGTSASAKELKKTLAGFDEMNILQEDGSTKVGGGGGGIEVPTPKFEQVEMPKWMDWILKNGSLIASIITGIATAITLYKGATILKEGGVFENIPLDKIIGISIIVGGLVYTIANIIEYLNDPSWENFGETIEGIGATVIGFGVTFGSVIAGAVGGVIILWGVVIKYWTEIKGFISGIYDWLEGKIGDVEKTFGGTAGNILKTIIQSGRYSLELFTDVIKGLRKIFDGFIQFFQGVFTGNWKKAWNGLAQIGEGALQILVSFAKGVWDNLLALINIGINGFIGGIKTVINGVIGAAEGVINGFIDAFNGIAKFLDMPRVKTLHIGRIALAKGGIVSMPGRGVPVGSAIAGERGQEAVLPLTDSQQMQLLGEAIGKYITINANITNTMNGRIISRELQKINNESDFSFNR